MFWLLTEWKHFFVGHVRPLFLLAWPVLLMQQSLFEVASPITSGRGSHGIPDRRDRVQIVHDVSRGELLAELFSSLSASMLAALVPFDGAPWVVEA